MGMVTGGKVDDDLDLGDGLPVVHTKQQEKLFKRMFYRNFHSAYELDRNGDVMDKNESITKSAFDKQHAGSHYKGMKIQPMEFALANNLNYGQANAIKYICRYEHKNGEEDLDKAIHCLELLREYKYGNK